MQIRGRRWEDAHFAGLRFASSGLASEVVLRTF